MRAGYVLVTAASMCCVLVTMKRPAPGDRQSLLADVVGHRKLEGAVTPANQSHNGGALTGLPDPGRNHDKYLAYPDRDEASGAASA